MGGVDIEDRLAELIRVLKTEGLTEITLCEGELRWTVKQAPHGVPATSASPEAPHRPDETGLADGTIGLTAPLVGTFYGRPTPEDPPFVRPGDVVAPGDVVGIIEAMKVMNEVRAEEAGRVRRILVEDGAAVEYGQVLIVFDRL